AEIWTGATSGEWSDPGNWAQSILPGPSTDVTIPDGSPYMPVLDNWAPLHSLTIQAGATLTTAGHNFRASTFTNQGTVILQGNEQVPDNRAPTSGTFLVVGDGIRDHMSLRFQNCFNLVINDTHEFPATFIPDHDISVRGNFTISSGTYDTFG